MILWCVISALFLAVLFQNYNPSYIYNMKKFLMLIISLMFVVSINAFGVHDTSKEAKTKIVTIDKADVSVNAIVVKQNVNIDVGKTQSFKVTENLAIIKNETFDNTVQVAYDVPIIYKGNHSLYKPIQFNKINYTYTYLPIYSQNKSNKLIRCQNYNVSNLYHSSYLRF